MQIYRIKEAVLISVLALLFTPLTAAMAQEMAAEPNSESRDLNLTIVYDNNPHDEKLETRWGFSCYIKGPEKTAFVRQRDGRGNGRNKR